MTSIEPILKYFPDITERQRGQFAALHDAYAEWNARINVISRKDIDELYVRHVLHSLAIAAVCRFDSGARILDVGCGGGFPSVPLAIMFPETQIVAADSIGKKITVVKGVCEAAGIGNIDARNVRVEQIGQRFDYVVTRAVAQTAQLVTWVWNKIERGRCGTLANGMLCLKGGDLQQELAATHMAWHEYPIAGIFDEPFFETKKVVYAER